MDLWSKGKRYTEYDGIIVSWDQDIDKDKTTQKVMKFWVENSGNNFQLIKHLLKRRIWM